MSGKLRCGLVGLALLACMLVGARGGDTAEAKPVDLLRRYPTSLTARDAKREDARPWTITSADIYRITKFHFQVGKKLQVDTGTADLGVGHCADGAVWAVVIPRKAGTLKSPALAKQQSIASIWLRFHPSKIDQLFPAGTVFSNGDIDLLGEIRRIAQTKIQGSWQAGGNAMIPDPWAFTVDVDTTDGMRRFFAVDTKAKTADYFAAFEHQAVKPAPPLTQAGAQAAFDKIWQSFDTTYAMFVLRPQVDWEKLRQEYRPKALAAKSSTQFAQVCAEMLRSLRDLHVWLQLAGEYVPVFNRPRTANANPAADRAILGDSHYDGHGVAWAVTSDQVGYIWISFWNNSDIPDQCQQILEQMRNTRGLIIDVRLNGGGSEDQARDFAARFVAKKYIYAYDRFRNGPKHTDLTAKIPREISPSGPWRYDRPVIVLIGQKCMSSNESFVQMMGGDPQAITMGDHTCGSSGNPKIISLPMEMTVSVPQWIDYLPNGQPLDERGVEPNIKFVPKPGAFTGKRDDLLSAALARLAKAPLPAKEVPGPAFVSAETAEASDNSRPKVVSVSPANGARDINPVTELRIRFDRPMDPMALKLNWKNGGAIDCQFPSYDAAKYEFTIPVRLPVGSSQWIEINPPMPGMSMSEARKFYPRDGFESAHHHLARLYSWQFTTAAAPKTTTDTKAEDIQKILPPDHGQITAGAKKTDLLKILREIQQKRKHLTSVAERVQNILMERRNGLFLWVQATGSSFQWQSPNLYFADVSDEMMRLRFAIGCDGRSWWYACSDPMCIKVCPMDQMQERDVTLCDPFDLLDQKPEKAAAGLELRYAGTASDQGHTDAIIERRQSASPSAESGLIRWKIDPQTGLPIEISEIADGVVQKERFFYDRINQPTPQEVFAVPRIKGIASTQPTALDGKYNRRFIQIDDGSDGTISLRWGRKGPGGRISSGLN